MDYVLKIQPGASAEQSYAALADAIMSPEGRVWQCFATAGEVAQVQAWWKRTPREKAIQALFGRARVLHSKDDPWLATPAQRDLIRKAEQECGVTLAEDVLLQLTRYEADAFINGLTVRDEIRRLTGRYDLHPRDLRMALRLLVALGEVFRARTGSGFIVLEEVTRAVEQMLQHRGRPLEPQERALEATGTLPRFRPLKEVRHG